jgi:ATP-binding cassette subfamily B protein
MTTNWPEVAWPVARLGEALQALALDHPDELLAPVPTSGEEEALAGWIEASAARLGLEAEPVEAAYHEVPRLLRSAAPALLRLPVSSAAGPQFLVLLGSRGKRCQLLAPGQRTETVPRAQLQAALCQPLEQELAPAVEPVAAAVSGSAAGRQRVRTALLGQLLAGRRLGGCWLVRPGSRAGGLAHAREAGLLRLGAVWLAAQVLEYVLWIVSWGLLGTLSLQGDLDTGWLAGWLLLLLSTIPCRLLGTWTAGSLALAAGGLLKRRLLVGALNLDLDETRHQGAGQLLGRVYDVAAVETLALSGGLLAVSAGLGLVAAGVVLALAGAVGLLALLLLWLGVAVALAWRYYRRRRRWTEERLALTDALVSTRPATRKPSSAPSGLSRSWRRSTRTATSRASACRH